MIHRKILVVDDELLIRDLLYDYFISKDYTIMTADGADEAMEIIRSNDDFDIVLTDIKMEGIDGLQLIESIREVDPGMPVIVMTGFPSVDTAIGALRKRAYDYIVKPFNINKLFAVVESAIKEHHDKRTRALGEVVHGE